MECCGDTVRGVESAPVALSTKLIYVLSAPVNFPETDLQGSMVYLTEYHVLTISNSFEKGRSSLEQEIKWFWDLEALRIKSTESIVCEKFHEDIKNDGKIYEVKLPFKENHPVLPGNYLLSKSRLTSLLQRLKCY